jgi:hypothetical protein
MIDFLNKNLQLIKIANNMSVLCYFFYCWIRNYFFIQNSSRNFNGITCKIEILTSARVRETELDNQEVPLE